MKPLHRAFAALLAAFLLLSAAVAPTVGLEDPEEYLGSWAGGDEYGETYEYYLDLLDYQDGVYSATLTIYRIWCFDGMTALLSGEEPTAALSTAAGDVYSVLATLDFSPDCIELTVLESDSPDLPAETHVLFAPVKEE